jgi:hypothetical protein
MYHSEQSLHWQMTFSTMAKISVIVQPKHQKLHQFVKISYILKLCFTSLWTDVDHLMLLTVAHGQSFPFPAKPIFSINLRRQISVRRPNASMRKIVVVTLALFHPLDDWIVVRKLAKTHGICIWNMNGTV